MGAYANPFDPDKLLWNGCPCGQHRSMLEHQMAMSGVDGDSRFFCETVDDQSPASQEFNSKAPNKLISPSKISLNPPAMIWKKRWLEAWSRPLCAACLVPI